MTTGLAELHKPSPFFAPSEDSVAPGLPDGEMNPEPTQALDPSSQGQTQGETQEPAQAPRPTRVEPGLGQHRGSFRILPADEDGNAVTTSTATPEPDPSSKLARTILFELDPLGPQPPAKEQIELQIKIEQVLLAARTVYPTGKRLSDSKFRLHFYALFNAARWGLEDALATEQAKREVNSIEVRLLEEVAGPLKNAQLTSLALWGTVMSIPFVVIYFALHLLSSKRLFELLQLLGVDGNVLANFMLLWIGCFIGVCLSYAFRTVAPTLADLTTPDDDYLRPRIRLLFAATLTMLVALFSLVGVIDIQIGTYTLSQVASNATLAFVVGAICGFSELALPDSVSKKLAL